MAKGKLAIGLDIGSTSVKMIQLKETRRRGEVIYSLQNFGMKPLPPEAIVDNALMNSTAIVQAIQELIGELRIKQKETAISVSGHSVIIKKIQMPQMSSAELDESIQWEAEQYIPFDVKDVNIDTQILSTEGSAATGQMDVLLVAAKKDMINDYTTVVAEAGLLPVVVDIDSFAVQNMFSANYESADAETVVLINAGASVVNINILDRGVTVFTRDVTIGGNQFTEEIQKQLNVSYEEAEALKIGGGRGDADAVVSAGHTGAAVAASTIKLRTLPGIDRPGIAAVLPTETNVFVLIDAGANIGATAEHLLHYAIMGSVYSRHVLHYKNPTVGLITAAEETIAE